MGRKFFIIICILMLFSTNVFGKLLDNSLEDIFAKIKKTFSYYGEVVAVISERNEAVVQFKDKAPKPGTEVVIYREGSPILNKISGKVVGTLEDMIGLISIKESSGTVALGDIIKNNGIEIGDKVRYPKRIIFVLKGVENLSSLPTQAYDIKSYLELAVSKYPEFEIINQNIVMNQPKDSYIVNMKIYIKDSSNPAKKRISIKIFSSYSNYTIGLFNESFQLSKKMLGYGNTVVPMNLSLKTPSQGGFNSAIPVYPMGGSTTPTSSFPTQQYSQYPSYPSYNTSNAKPIINRNTPVYPAYTQNMQTKFKPNNTHKMPPAPTPYKNIVNYRDLFNLKDKIKFFDFYKNRIVYCSGQSVVLGEIEFHKFRKLDEVSIESNDNVLSVELVDVDNNGEADIVVNILGINKMNSKIFKVVNGKITEVKGDFNYILGKYDFDNNGKYEFAGQNFMKDKIYGAFLYKLELKNNNIIKIRNRWIPRGFRLTFYTNIKIGKKDKGIAYINGNKKLLIYKNGEKIYESSFSVENIKPFNLAKNRIGVVEKDRIKEIISDNVGNITDLEYSSSIDGDIKGCFSTVYELMCILNKKNKSFLVSFPLVK